MSAYFVTATGTDIGKTFVVAGLIRHLRAVGKPVAALKPVVSGFDMAKAGPSDPGVLLRALGEPVTPQAIAELSPWRFSAPLSPDMAATREHRAINFARLVEFCREKIASARATLFIEGVGGIMVPLDEHHTVLDWMSELGLPTILVAGSYLGTISHTLTALDVLRCRNVSVAAVVINESPESPVPLSETAATVGRFAPDAKVATLARARASQDGEFARLSRSIDAEAGA